MKLSRLCIVIILLLVLVGTATASPRMGGTLRVGTMADLVMLDIHRSTQSSDRYVLYHVFETLVTVDENMDIIPMLAKDWEVNDEGTLWTFYLREGVLFHNGEEMTACDVKYSIERFKEVSPRRVELEAFEDIVIVDDYTIEIHLAYPVGAFLVVLGNPFGPLAIIPEGLAEEQGGTITDPIGTGPFSFVEWRPDHYVRLERFEDYVSAEGEPSGFGGEKIAYVDEVRFMPIVDPSVRVASLEAGDIDIMLSVLPNDFNRLEEHPQVVVESVPGLTWGALWFGPTKPPTDNKLIRQAIAHAMNLEEIAMLATWGLGPIAPSPIPPESPWHTPVHDFYYEHDLDRAKELLEEAGYDGEEIVISTSRVGFERERTAILLEAQLQAAGINVKLEWLEWSAFISERWNTGDFHLLNGGITGRPDPDATYYAYSHSSSALNFYDNPLMDELLERGQRTVDFEERREIYSQVQELIMEDLPWMSLFFYSVNQATRTNVHGYEIWSADYPRAWNVWLED